MSEPTTQAHQSPGRRAWRRFKHNRLAVFSGWYLLALLAFVIAWPVALELANISSSGGKAFAVKYDPDTLSDLSFSPPTAAHWFGTDVHGRDLLSRVLYGAQVSLAVGAVG